MKVDLCVLASYELEHNYIVEFLLYYFDVIQIDTIHIIDDCDKNNHKLSDIEYIAINIQLGRINYIELKERKKQEDIYYDFYLLYKNTFDWCCIFDCDEFLALYNHSNIKLLLCDDSIGLNHNCDSIQVISIVYGDNDFMTELKGNVMEIYLESCFENKTWIKSIIRGGIENPHIGIHNSYNTDNLSAIKTIDGLYSNNCDYFYDILERNKIGVLNHYQTKSTQEYIQRKFYSNSIFMEVWNNVFHWFVNDYKDYFNMFKEQYFMANKWTCLKELIFKKTYKDIISK